MSRNQSHAPRWSSRAPQRPGVIMIITLLGIMLMVALILFVLNIGGQVNRRVSAQNSADATAIAAATWTARSLNLIAMNNTNMARTIALINVLDAMPQASWNVEDETKAFLEVLEAQLARGIGGGPDKLTDHVTVMLEQLRAALQQTLVEVEPVAEMFNTIDVKELTHYNRDGALWRQMKAMDEMNQMLVENLAQVVQRNAILAGEQNLPDFREIDSGLMLLPIEPTVPYQRGRFDDFRDPVVKGILPTGIDDMTTNRGPWDTVFGWRDDQAQVIGGEYVAGDIDGARGGGGRGPGASGTGGNQGRRVGGQRVVNGYTPYGPRTWYLRKVDSFTEREMPYTRLDMWVREISEIKLNRLWPGVTRHWSHYHNTEWNTSFEDSKELSERFFRTRQLPRVLQTAYFMVEIKSKYPIGHANFMDDGTWASTGESPRIEYFGNQNGPNHGMSNRGTGGYAGWYDWDRWGLERLSDHVWRNQWDYRVRWDQTIGINPEFEEDDEGNQTAIEQPVYRIDYYVFAGANTDWDKQPDNPWDGFNPAATEAPSPMNFDHSRIGFTQTESRWQYLTYLSAVRASDLPQAWPSRFRGGRPTNSMVAIAQAKVFNNHSFDMWTPMWHAKLMPVGESDARPGIEDWLMMFEIGTPPEGVSTEENDGFARFLESLRQMAPDMITH